MAIYIVTGKLGNGKTLISVARIRDALRAGRRVATNLDLSLSSMFSPFVRALEVLRVPDKPTRSDLDAIGCGNPSYDESRNGLLVLDECGTWFNSRNWQDKTRGDVNAWFLHARKLGWDVLLIVQDLSLLDSQAREAIAEHVVYCRRIDNIAVPFIGTLWKMATGSRLPLPRVHTARVMYGTDSHAMLSDRWVYRGDDLFAAYDTRQAFLADYPHGTHSVLSPWHQRGRFMVPRDREFYMRMTKIYLRRFRVPMTFAAGLVAGSAVLASMAFALLYRDARAQQQIDMRTAVRQAAVEVMLSAQPATAPQSASTGPAPVIGARILGSAQLGRQWIYDLELVTANGITRISSDDLRASGYTMIPYGRCHVTLALGTEGFAARCSPHNAPSRPSPASPEPSHELVAAAPVPAGH